MKYISSLPHVSWEQTWPRTISILGSTGSIGRSALQCIAQNPEKFIVVALAGANNTALLAEQANIYRPEYLGVLTDKKREELLPLLAKDYTPEIVVGPKGYAFLAQLSNCSTILSAQTGAAGLCATMAAVSSGKVIALANKESLVMAGTLIRRECSRTGAVILPVDSEHNAIFQCLQAVSPDQVSRLILTASGGSLRDKTEKELERVTPEQALKHPNWSMGAKITIDSATLMNKGLELIEAVHLYAMPADKIDIVIHKESIIHSLVECIDGSQLAQLSTPDMRIAISHCIGWPTRMHTEVPRLNLPKCGTLTFAEPDTKRFPCLNLAREALKMGDNATIALNAANEIAVDAFLNKKISFKGIAQCVEKTLENYAAESLSPATSVSEIFAIDSKAREIALHHI